MKLDGARPRSCVRNIAFDAGSATLVLCGEVDLAEVNAFCEALDESLGGAGRLLVEAGITAVDLRQATFVDAAVMNLICVLARALEPRSLRVIGPCPQARLVLETTGVCGHVEIV